jgi:hypothetical protein
VAGAWPVGINGRGKCGSFVSLARLVGLEEAETQA